MACDLAGHCEQLLYYFYSYGKNPSIYLIKPVLHTPFPSVNIALLYNFITQWLQGWLSPYGPLDECSFSWSPEQKASGILSDNQFSHSTVSTATLKILLTDPWKQSHVPFGNLPETVLRPLGNSSMPLLALHVTHSWHTLWGPYLPSIISVSLLFLLMPAYAQWLTIIIIPQKASN